MPNEFWSFVAGLSLGWLSMLLFVAYAMGNKVVK